jgi:hypothetical protein
VATVVHYCGVLVQESEILYGTYTDYENQDEGIYQIMQCHIPEDSTDTAPSTFILSFSDWFTGRHVNCFKYLDRKVVWVKVGN